MDESISYLKSRWLSPGGSHFIAEVLNQQTTPEKYKKACMDFFGRDNSFILSEVHRGVVEFEDLRGMDLSGKNLSGMLFGKSELSFANFEGSKLDEVSFGAAKIYSTSFKNVVVTAGVNFFECYARNSNFQGVHLSNANFYHADLVGADFTDAVLEHCDFGAAMFQDAIFDGAQMIECDVRGLHLLGNQRNAKWFLSSILKNKEYIVWED